jgi:S1-C subfamily serine protease
LAKKILDDLKQYGSVNRGVLELRSSPSDEGILSNGNRPGTVNGVYITSVMSKSAAAEAGLKEGDIIQSIDGTTGFINRVFGKDCKTST